MSRRHPGMYEPTSEGLSQQSRMRCPQLATRPGFHGPCHKGHYLCVRAVKRAEAMRRNAGETPETARAGVERLAAEKATA